MCWRLKRGVVRDRTCSDGLDVLTNEQDPPSARRRGCSCPIWHRGGGIPPYRGGDAARWAGGLPPRGVQSDHGSDQVQFQSRSPTHPARVFHRSLVSHNAFLLGQQQQWTCWTSLNVSFSRTNWNVFPFTRAVSLLLPLCASIYCMEIPHMRIYFASLHILAAAAHSQPRCVMPQIKVMMIYRR